MKSLLAHLLAGHTLSRVQAVEAFTRIMSGQAGPAQIGALLALIQARGPTLDEIVGAATVMRAKLVPVPNPAGLTILDTCGTGGTHSRYFNVSTAAALVVAAVGRSRGYAVAKHGNRSVTSTSGSSEVLDVLGVKFPVPPAVLSQCLDEAGFCFCFAPAHHPAMKHAALVRAELGFRTLFNLLGPLANPAGATRQVLGVYSPTLTEPMAQVLAQLGTEQAMVVHGRFAPPPESTPPESTPPEPPSTPTALRRGLPPEATTSVIGEPGNDAGLGELSLTGPTRITHLKSGQIRTFELHPRDLGLSCADPAPLYVTDPQASAALIQQVLQGTPGAARDMVCLNAAAVLIVADLATDFTQGLRLAAAALDDGSAQHVLRTVVRLTRQAG